MATDAGMRRYFRLSTPQTTLVAVDANPETEDNRAFVDIAGRLHQSGLSVPQIHHYNLEKGFLLIEDLGDQHLQQWLASNNGNDRTMYGKALDTLIHLQQHADAGGLPLFDREFILFELNIFEQWYLQKHLRTHTTGAISQALTQLKEMLVSNCAEQPQVFMHRDFHCRNLMIKGNTKIAIIDFQGAMLGPVTYDPGSLLKDVYVQVPGPLENHLCDHHRQSMLPHIEQAQYQRWYQLTALQRHLKILGLFCRLHYRDGKTQYLSHLSSVKARVIATLEQYPECKAFSELFRQLDKTGNGKA